MTDKFLLFAGSRFYPFGGWEDFVGYFDTLDEAKKRIIEAKDFEPYCGWAHIVHDDKIIWEAYGTDKWRGSKWEWNEKV